jgi:PKD repeat protein
MKIRQPVIESCAIVLLLFIAMCPPVPVYGGIYDPWHAKVWFTNNFKSLCDRYPTQASFESVGETYRGNDIWLFKFGNPRGGVVLWDAQLHGNEDFGSEILWLIVQWLFSDDPVAQVILERNYVLMIPVVNVDSYGRYNARNVNLNRNFETGWSASAEYPGPYACSEPETQVLRSVYRAYDPAFYVNLHQGASSSRFWYYSRSDETVADQVLSRAGQIASDLGVTLYRSGPMGSTGFAIGDAYSLVGASSWLAEVDVSWTHTDEEWQRLVKTMYPRCLAMFIAMCELCAVDSPPPEDWTCGHCSVEFNTEQELRDHLAANHAPEAETCQCLDCGYVFDYTPDWTIDIPDHTGYVSISPGQVACPSCGSTSVQSPPHPPVASFICTPTSVPVQEQITFNASASFDLDNDLVSYGWNFDDSNLTATVDPIIVHIYTVPKAYNVTLTVTDSEGLNSSHSQTVWAMATTFVSISTSSASTAVGVTVDISGALRDRYGNGLQNETVRLSYAVGSNETWTPITSDTTDDLGNYFATWIPSTLDSFAIKVEWAGNQTYFGTYNVTTVEALQVPTAISLSLSSSTSYLGFTIEISGNLTSAAGSLSRTPVLLSYSTLTAETWSDIEHSTTASDGSYAASWVPSATGNYFVRASWTGNASFLGASATASLAVIPFEDQNVFSVTSNSTISELTFESSSRELRFTVSGSSGIPGYVDVYVPKTLIADIAEVEVKLDDEQTSYVATALDGSWCLRFTCVQDTQKIVVGLGEVSVPFTGTPLGQVVVFATLFAATVIFTVLFFSRKRTYLVLPWKDHVRVVGCVGIVHVGV